MHRLIKIYFKCLPLIPSSLPHNRPRAGVRIGKKKWINSHGHAHRTCRDFSAGSAEVSQECCEPRTPSTVNTQFYVKEQAQAWELKSSVHREAAQRLTETLALHQTNHVTLLWFTNPSTNHKLSNANSECFRGTLLEVSINWILPNIMQIANYLHFDWLISFLKKSPLYAMITVLIGIQLCQPPLF